MEITHGEDRSLLSWLIVQEKVIRMWIEETMNAGSGEQALVENLEAHRSWLAERINELTRHAA
ncbi:MAG: hypothetical protein AAFW68_04415 [Pseudomonadota bacterium]